MFNKESVGSERLSSGKIRHFENSDPSREGLWQYFIEEDSQTGRLLLVSERHDRKDWQYDAVISIEFDDQNKLTEALNALKKGDSKHIVLGKGTVRDYESYTQTGSPWNADEAVAGAHHDFTKSGYIACALSIENGHLDAFQYRLEEERS